MRKAGWNGISSSCALPPAGARASRSSTRNSTRRAGSTRPSSRACRRPPASPKSWRRHSIACEPIDEPVLGPREERPGMPFFRRLEPRHWAHRGRPHPGFMSAQILQSMLRRVLIVAATVAPITLAAAGATAHAEAGVAPFDGSLQRLAEILGALHYLRNICGANEGQKWRNEMQSLVDAEAPSGERRVRMIASFNRGYRGYQQSYRTCTPAADLVIRRYLEDGSKIARAMSGRFANSPAPPLRQPPRLHPPPRCGSTRPGLAPP